MVRVIYRSSRILLVVLFMLSVLAIMFSITSSDFELQLDQERSLSFSEEPEGSIYIYRSYVNRRGFLRILAVSRCLPEKFALTLRLNNRYASIHLVEALPIEGRCPGQRSPSCTYNAYMFEQKLPLFDIEKTGEVSVGTRAMVIEVAKTSKRKDGELTICVPPVFWYTDWTKLIVFIEWWTAQGANQFFIYFHSASKDVKTVLDFYQSQGLITLIMWPLLPSSPEIDPNKSIYRLSHSLAHNDCVNRIETEFGALVDIDEIILARNSSITSFVRAEFSRQPIVGSLSFTQHLLVYHPTLTPSSFSFESLDFHGILGASQYLATTKSKVVFRAKAVRRLSPQFVLDFYGDHWHRKTISVEEAVLLHNQHNYTYEDVKAKGSPVNLMKDIQELEDLREQLVRRKWEIFPNGADFKRSTQAALQDCLARQSEQNKCESPVLGCESVMRELEEWITAEDDVYSIL